MSGQSEDELKAGISIFARLCSGLGLACTPTRSFGSGNPVRFDLSKDDKQVRLTLGYEFVTDLRGTTEFQSALQPYLAELALRIGEPSFDEYATLSGLPVRFRIDFPFRMSAEGGSFESVHVVAKSGIESVFEAKFSVRIADTAAVQIVSLESVITEVLVINAVRKFIDTKQATFHPEGKHPTRLQIVTIEGSDYDFKSKKFVYHKATDDEIADFLKRKVYWLGFRRGNQATRVCIADPYDAVYLGVTSERLQQAGAILAADGILQSDASALYANAGIKLLQEARTLNRERDTLLKTESSEEKGVRSLPGTPTRNARFDVFISHASEDKGYVGPLANALEAAGIRVWFDKHALEWGDDLRSSIDRGLTNCRYGIVVFSKAFLQKKKWTEYELNSLFAIEQLGQKVILPIWHGITHEHLVQYSPAFADRLAKISSNDSVEDIVKSLLAMLGAALPTANSEPAKLDSGRQIDSLGAQRAAVVNRIAELSANSFSEDLEQQARQVVGYVMTLNGQQLLRQLLIHGTFRSTQQIMPQISMKTQNEQMKIAKEAGIVKQQPGTPTVAGGYYTISPQFVEPLKKVLYEESAKNR